VGDYFSFFLISKLAQHNYDMQQPSQRARHSQASPRDLSPPDFPTNPGNYPLPARGVDNVENSVEVE